jgi:hypothetical protein
MKAFVFRVSSKIAARPWAGRDFEWNLAAQAVVLKGGIYAE